MSLLIVHELITTLHQVETVDHRPKYIRAIRPHLLIFNKSGLGAGTLKMQIWDSRNRVIATSETLNIADMTTLNYAHKRYRFQIDAALRAGATYRIALVPGGGYSFSESAYVGWCNAWETRIRDVGYSPSSGVWAPLDQEFWEWKEVRRGVA